MHSCSIHAEDDGCLRADELQMILRELRRSGVISILKSFGKDIVSLEQIPSSPMVPLLKNGE